MPLIKPISDFSKMMLQLELFRSLAIAQDQRAAGRTGRSLSQVMKELRRRILHGARSYEDLI